MKNPLVSVVGSLIIMTVLSIYPVQVYASGHDTKYEDIIAQLDGLKQLLVDYTSRIEKTPKVLGTSSNANQFKIIWQLSTQLEEIADLDKVKQPKRAALLENIKSKVDGYSIVEVQGQLFVAYWPTRPRKCAFDKRLDENTETENFILAEIINKKEVVNSFTLADLSQDCRDLKNEYLNSVWNAGSSTYRAMGYTRLTLDDYLQAQSLDRVIRNLDLVGEQASGKSIRGHDLFSNRNFTYSPSTDTLELVSVNGKPKFPNTYSALLRNGIKPGDPSLMYEEPSIQSKNGTQVKIPLEKGGDKIVSLPENIRILDMIGKAFEDQNATPPKMTPNIRKWKDDESAKIVTEANKSPFYGGINFEGGTSGFIKRQGDETKFENNARGIAWMLKNTDDDIFLLMPAYWTDEQMSSIAGQNTLHVRTRQFITKLNSQINKINKLPRGTKSVCDDRLHFIIGSYGYPFHPRQLPVREDGKVAGTVSAVVLSVASFRDSFCGSSDNPTLF